MPPITLNRRNLLSAGALGGAALALSSFETAGQEQKPSRSMLEQIRGRGELRIGTPSGEPWFFRDERSGEWKGIGWGVGVALAKELGVKPVAVETTWGTAVAGLQAGQFDVLFAMDATPQRALAIDFPVQPMFYYAQGVLLRDGLSARTWADLDKPDVRIGVVLGTSPDRDISVRLANARIERFPNADEAATALAANRVDAISLFHPALVILRNHLKRGTIQLPEPVRASATSAGVRRDVDTSWRDWLGHGIAYLYETGATQKIYEEFLAFRGIAVKDAPAIMRELWTKN